MVWNPRYQIDSAKIESTQKQFLLFALRNFRWDSQYNLPPYTSRLKLINLPTLVSCREMRGIIFMVKLLTGSISSPSLLADVSFNVPSRVSRHFCPIFLKACKTNFELHDPLRCLCQDFNCHSSTFDISDPLFSIKKAILSALNK